MLGLEVPELGNITMCNKFEPIFLEGQICYALDISDLKRMRTETGRAGGLFLLLDPNPQKLNFGGADMEEELYPFKIYIDTLGQY